MISPMTLIAGPCIIEDEGFTLEVAKECKRLLAGLPVDYYFKASFDKANRTSIDGFRGPGLKEGLKILERVKSEVGVKVCTDFHTPDQAEPVASVVDFIQVPAFLCRQTDMIVAAAEMAIKHKIKLNVKKGQFISPWDAKHIVDKVRQVEQKMGSKKRGTPWLFLTERGFCLGYNALVVDMISFECMKSFGVPVLYDATHSVQIPSGGIKSSLGRREYIECLARAAIAAGASGIFLECHPYPVDSKSDAATAFYLQHLRVFVQQLLELRQVVSQMPKLIPESQFQNSEEIFDW